MRLIARISLRVSLFLTVVILFYFIVDRIGTIQMEQAFHFVFAFFVVAWFVFIESKLEKIFDKEENRE